MTLHLVTHPKFAKSVPVDSLPPLLEERPATIREIVSNSPRITPNCILLASLLTIFLSMLGFITLRIPNPIDCLGQALTQLGNGVSFSQISIVAPQLFNYTFQLPFALFIGAVLGPWLGTFCVALYLLASIVWIPALANGGGLNYIQEPGFFYWLAILAGTFIAGMLTQQAYHHKRPAMRTALFYTTGIWSVLAVHALAIIMLTIALPFLPNHDWTQWPTLTSNLTAAPILYDLLSASIFLWFTRYARLVFYPALY